MLLKSEFVRRQRHERGWTQEQLAEFCGISVRTVQRLEKTGMASMDTTNALAAVFEVDRLSLLADDVQRVTAEGSAEAAMPWRLLLTAAGTFALGLLLGQLL